MKQGPCIWLQAAHCSTCKAAACGQGPSTDLSLGAPGPMSPGVLGCSGTFIIAMLVGERLDEQVVRQ
jgi:hypothetical protein